MDWRWLMCARIRTQMSLRLSVAVPAGLCLPAGISIGTAVAVAVLSLSFPRRLRLSNRRGIKKCVGCVTQGWFMIYREKPSPAQTGVESPSRRTRFSPTGSVPGGRDESAGNVRGSCLKSRSKSGEGSLSASRAAMNRSL